MFNWATPSDWLEVLKCIQTNRFQLLTNRRLPAFLKLWINFKHYSYMYVCTYLWMNSFAHVLFGLWPGLWKSAMWVQIYVLWLISVGLKVVYTPVSHFCVHVSEKYLCGNSFKVLIKWFCTCVHSASEYNK